MATVWYLNVSCAKWKLHLFPLPEGRRFRFVRRTRGSDVLGQDQRDAIDLANQTVHDVATVRKDWATIAGKPPTGGGGGRSGGGGAL